MREVTIKRERKQAEELFRSLAANSPVGVYIVQKGKFVYTNQQFQHYTGYREDELLSMEAVSMVFPDDRETVRNNAIQMLKGKRVVPYEFRIINKNGEIKWALESVASIQHQGKQATIGSYQDITDRKRAENRIRRLNQLQALLLDPDILEKKLKKITDGVVDIFNADFCRIWLIDQGDRCDTGCVHAAVTEGPHVCRYRDKCLNLIASSGRYTHLDGETHRRVPFFGCYKIGGIASGEYPSFLTNNVANDPRVHNHEWAKQLGLVSFAGFKLQPPHGETKGVLALFSQSVIMTRNIHCSKASATLL